MKIGTKLTTGFGVAIVGLIICNIIAIFDMMSLNSGTKEIVEDWFPKTVWSNDIIDALNDNARAIRNILLSDNPQELSDAKKRFEADAIVVTESMKKLEEKVKLPKEKDILQKIQTVRAKYTPTRNKIVELYEAGKADEAKKLLFTDFREIQNDYIKFAGELIEYQKSLMIEDGKNAENTDRKSVV